MHKPTLALAAAGFLAATVTTTYAATPDGAAGAWADAVVSTSQALTKSGGAVAPDRSDATDILGMAESTGTAYDTVVNGSFYSLGFGGSVVVRFDNSIINGAGNDLTVYEVTGGPTYGDEFVRVDASRDGVNWTTLGTGSRDASFDLGSMTCAQYVRITDTTNPAAFEATADAYDLDGVRALNSSDQPCPPPVVAPQPWGGLVHSQGYWKNHSGLAWNGHTIQNAVKGNYCLAYDKQAVGFYNNWLLNSENSDGVNFQDATFDSQGSSSRYDGWTTAELYAEAESTLNSCSPTNTTAQAQVMELTQVLDWINNGMYIWE